MCRERDGCTAKPNPSRYTRHVCFQTPPSRPLQSPSLSLYIYIDIYTYTLKTYTYIHVPISTYT